MNSIVIFGLLSMVALAIAGDIKPRTFGNGGGYTGYGGGYGTGISATLGLFGAYAGSPYGGPYAYDHQYGRRPIYFSQPGIYGQGYGNHGYGHGHHRRPAYGYLQVRPGYSHHDGYYPGGYGDRYGYEGYGHSGPRVVKSKYGFAG